jgi:CcmD family protein
MRMMKRMRWLLAGASPIPLLALAWLAPALIPGAALAQEFQKVEGPLRPDLPAGPFVGAAYGFIWIAILLYVLYVARGLSRVRKQLDELRRELQRTTGGAGPRP